MIKKSILCSFAFLLVLASFVGFLCYSISRVEDFVFATDECCFDYGLSLQDSSDIDYSFSGSNLIIPVCFIIDGVKQSPTFESFSFNFDSSHFIIYYYRQEGVNSVGSYDKEFEFEFNSQQYLTVDFDIGLTTLELDFAYRIASGFDFRVYKVTVSPFYSTVRGVYYYQFCYFDSSDRELFFNFYGNNNMSNIVSLFVPRTYYFSTSLDDNQFYSSGFQDGKAIGFSSGESVGYDKGFSVGKRVGRDAGFIEGVESAHEYTFLGLIGAVFDAPLNTFISLLNFEILGFNMLSAFTGLLTLAVIIFFIRLIMGRK